MRSHELYLTEVLRELLEMARSAKADYAAARTQRGEGESLFEAGRALAFYECFSLLVMQLDAYGVPRESVGLAVDLDVERELLQAKYIPGDVLHMLVDPLQPWETALVGEITFENGEIVSNDASNRIELLLASGLLEPVAHGNWRGLYRDRADGRLWELTWPQGNLQGGGPPSLHVLSVDEARERYHDELLDGHV